MKARQFQKKKKTKNKTSTSASLTTGKPLTVVNEAEVDVLFFDLHTGFSGDR